jgi:uncharacterized membrane protein YbhN (UPF0104 family)
VLAALGLLLRRWGREFQWGAFAASFTALDGRWLAVAAAAALATYWGRALRWSVMLRPLRSRPNLWGLFTATAIGFTAIVLLGRPAELVRPYLISVRERVAFSSQLGAWFLERLADMLAMVVVFGLALTQMPAQGAELGTHLKWTLRAGGYLAAATAVALVVILVVVRQSPELVRTRLLEALGWLPPEKLRRVERMTTAFLEGLAAIRGRTGLIWLTAYTALEWVLIALCTLALFKAYPGTSKLGISQALVFMGLVGFGSLLQIPGLGGGVQIASVVVLRELYGLPVELATSVAVGVWATTFVVIVPIGLPLALHEGFAFKRIKQLSMEAEP